MTRNDELGSGQTSPCPPERLQLSHIVPPLATLLPLQPLLCPCRNFNLKI